MMKISEGKELHISTQNMTTDCGDRSSQKQTIRVKQEAYFKGSQDMKLQIPFLADIIKQEIKSDYECVTVAENCSNIRQCEGKGEVKEEPDDQITVEQKPGSDAEYRDTCPHYSCTSSSSQQDILDRHVKLEHSATDVGFNKDDLQGVLTGDKRCRTCKTESTPRKRSPETDREDNIKLKPAESFSFKTCLEQAGDLNLDTRNCDESCAIVCPSANKTPCFQTGHLNNSALVRSELCWDKSEKFYICALCKAEFSTQSNLNSHKRIHKKDKNFNCDVCGAAFTQHSSLMSHKRLHTGEKPYRCNVCGVGFRFLSSLARHKRKHAGEKSYKCDVCGAAFTKSSNLKSHKRIHTGEKPYKCDICNADFTEKRYLKSHRRTHTGEKPYKCDFCSAKFKQKVHLKSHSRTHTGEKPFKCDICSAEFARKCHLKSHIRTHTGEKPYKCDVCGGEFTQRSSLKSHKRTHTGEKPYKCDVCCAEFTQLSNLKSHRRTHTGERPYKCDVCSVNFAFSCNLAKHRRTHMQAVIMQV